MTHETSKYICELLSIDYIDFSISENFIKLMDIIFRLHKFFNLHIRQRIKNFLEDTLTVLQEEIKEAKLEQPLKVKNFTYMIKNEHWSPKC